MIRKISKGEALLLASLITMTVILALAWREVWGRGETIRSLEHRVEVLTADKAELAGEIEEMNGTPIEYLILYRRASLARFERIEPRWDQIIETAWRLSRKYGVEPKLTLAKIEHESFFNPTAVGPSGEFGLMQIYPPAWPQFDTAKGFDIEYNLDFGIRIFAGCMKRASGDVREALRLYNGRGELPEGMKPYADRVLSSRVLKIK